MKNLVVSAQVLVKLRDKHKVSVREIEQCFENLSGSYLEDSREDHRTDPPTLWFIALTNRDRALKVVFMFIGDHVHIKTAYEPNSVELEIYQRRGT
jgi:uncharacterized DUF497 family protein